MKQKAPFILNKVQLNWLKNVPESCFDNNMYQTPPKIDSLGVNQGQLCAKKVKFRGFIYILLTISINFLGNIALFVLQ